ncbi:MAG: HEAT repeat domain-containing protein [Desulfobacterota bacterium]|nr:HEAT repeat domain-containing protein [Thermodesulfobacteriota bacterium]
MFADPPLASSRITEEAESDDSQPVATDIKLMEQFGADLTRAIPALIEGLQCADVRIRRNAAFGLGELGADAAPAMEALTHALRSDSDFDVRRNAAFALGEIGAPAIPSLLSMLNDKDPRIRRIVTAALVRIGTPAVPKLTHLLTTSDTITRRNAAVILGNIGPDATDAIPALEKALQDPDRGFQWTVRQALRRIKQTPQEHAEFDNQTLLGTQTDITPPLDVRTHASNTIENLLVRLSDEKPDVRRRAAFALARLGSSALPVLLNALTSDNTLTRKNAAFALGEMGSSARSAIPALTSLKHDPDRTVRWVAEHAVKKIEGGSSGR